MSALEALVVGLVLAGAAVLLARRWLRPRRHSGCGGCGCAKGAGGAPQAPGGEGTRRR